MSAPSDDAHKDPVVRRDEEAVEQDATETSDTAESADTADTTSTLHETARWYHWHDPGTSRQEKRLLLKLDWFLLSYSCLCFFIKQLDGNNVANAYVSGMAADLGFGPGNELSWMNTFFTCGVLVGGPLANLVITVVRPRVWLPFCMAAWSLFVLGMCRGRNARQYYALRFCCGLFESAAWPGITYTLGCWYRRGELARRSSLFVVSGVLGQMFSGYLQSALYSGMDGKGGLRAWRWLFVFDFVLAVPIVVYGLAVYPDTPETTTAFYLSAWDRRRVVERIRDEGRAPVGRLDFSVVPRIFGSWQVYAFTLAYALWSLTAGSYVMQYFALYLAWTGRYSVAQINNIPTAMGAVNVVVMLATGVVADKTRRRGPVCAVVGSVLAAAYVLLAVWHVPHALRMAGFVLMGCYGCFTPLLAGWVNESCAGDQQKRAFILGFMVSVGGAVLVPFQQCQFPSADAPHYAATHGWASALAMVVAMTLWLGFGLPAVQAWGEGRQHRSTIVEYTE